MTPPKRILVIDYGDRRTGLAATDPTGTIPIPLETIVTKDQMECISAIRSVAMDRETELILIGLPLAPDGGLGARGRTTVVFAKKLIPLVSPIPVMGMDERHSSNEAHARLKAAGIKAAQRKKKGVDGIAALCLLENWLRGEQMIDLENP